MMTSGEVTHRSLLSRPDPSWKALGSKCLHFTWGDRGAVDISSLGLQVVSDPSHAEFILAHGTEGMATSDGLFTPCSIPEFEAVLTRCASVGGIPMIVANPDLVTVDGCVAVKLFQTKMFFWVL